MIPDRNSKITNITTWPHKKTSIYSFSQQTMLCLISTTIAMKPPENIQFIIEAFLYKKSIKSIIELHVQNKIQIFELIPLLSSISSCGLGQDR